MASFLLGPGSSCTHAAVKLCAKEGTLIQWVGEEGVAAYAGDPLSGDGERLKFQVAVAMNPKWRGRAIAYMFSFRFGEKVSTSLDENTMRGMEGSRVKALYAKLALEHKVSWHGRKTGQNSWDTTDALNQAISIANGHLIQAATIAVIAAGFSPSIGFLHSGFNRAYSCDIADLHKFSVSVPLAFKLFAKGMRDPKKEVRHAIRDIISEKRLLDVMITNSIDVVNAGFDRS